jgi:hypothetical protein
MKRSPRRVVLPSVFFREAKRGRSPIRRSRRIVKRSIRKRTKRKSTRRTKRKSTRRNTRRNARRNVRRSRINRRRNTRRTNRTRRVRGGAPEPWGANHDYALDASQARMEAGQALLRRARTEKGRSLRPPQGDTFSLHDSPVRGEFGVANTSRAGSASWSPVPSKTIVDMSSSPVAESPSPPVRDSGSQTPSTRAWVRKPLAPVDESMETQLPEPEQIYEPALYPTKLLPDDDVKECVKRDSDKWEPDAGTFGPRKNCHVCSESIGRWDQSHCRLCGHLIHKACASLGPCKMDGEIVDGQKKCMTPCKD